MNRREARKALGSRVSRRVGTKTKVIPGAKTTKRQPKFRTHRAAKGQTRLGVRVQRVFDEHKEGI
jgi:hypothetical protein